MSGHTPGPWRMTGRSRKSSNFGGYQAFVMGPQVGRIATVSGGNSDDREITEANAYLIAAAPEMLEALGALEWSGRPLPGGEPGSYCPACRALRYFPGTHHEACVLGSAIAAAKGGPA